MYIRMGPDNPANPNRGEQTHIHLDSIILYSREALDNYIHHLQAMRDELWPVEQEEEKQ
jgi:hypothetical protein